MVLLFSKEYLANDDGTNTRLVREFTAVTVSSLEGGYTHNRLNDRMGVWDSYYSLSPKR
jgi:hypothetical protein